MPSRRLRKQTDKEIAQIPPFALEPDFMFHRVLLHSFSLEDFHEKYHSLWTRLEERVTQKYGPSLYRGVDLWFRNEECIGSRKENLSLVLRKGCDISPAKKGTIIYARLHLPAALDLSVYHFERDKWGYDPLSRFKPRFVCVYDASALACGEERLSYYFQKDPQEALQAVLTFHVAAQREHFLEKLKELLTVSNRKVSL